MSTMYVVTERRNTALISTDLMSDMSSMVVAIMDGRIVRSGAKKGVKSGVKSDVRNVVTTAVGRYAVLTMNADENFDNLTVLANKSASNIPNWLMLK